MSESQLGIVFVGLFKTMVLITGAVVIYWGYKLIRTEAERPSENGRPATHKVKLSIGKFNAETTTPTVGVVLCLFGATIICICLLSHGKVEWWYPAKSKNQGSAATNPPSDTP